MEKLCYRFVLSDELKPFESEIDHALKFVESYYPVTRVGDPEKSIRYGGDCADIPSSLFPDHVSIDDNGIHLNRSRFDDIQQFWPTDDPVVENALTYDAVGLIFFMISRLEEREAVSLDRHDRFESGADSAIKEGYRERAVADEAAEALATLICGGVCSPVGETEIVLTHDVDRLKCYHRFHEPLRYAVGDVVKRRNFRMAKERLTSYLGREPWDSFSDLMTLSERYGLVSRFYFMGPSDHRMDSPYALTMPRLLRKVVDEVQNRGHRIGFHPGYTTLQDPGEFRRQKDGLETVVGTVVWEGRQHVLRYDCASTPALWDEQGMSEDYTLAYPDDIGFRNGTCRSHKAYDLVIRKTLDLDQTATCIADFSLFDPRYQNISIDAALEKSLRLFKVTQKFKGRFVILYHSGQPSGKQRCFYEALLKQVT